MADTCDEQYERRSHHLIFTEGELDLPALRATPELQALFEAGWQIAKYEVVFLEDGYAVTIFLRRARSRGN